MELFREGNELHRQAPPSGCASERRPSNRPTWSDNAPSVPQCGTGLHPRHATSYDRIRCPYRPGSRCDGMVIHGLHLVDLPSRVVHHETAWHKTDGSFDGTFRKFSRTEKSVVSSLQEVHSIAWCTAATNVPSASPLLRKADLPPLPPRSSRISLRCARASP